MKVLCDVYKSLSKSDYYLFVKRDDALSRVPESLLNTFGEHELTLTLALSPERRLAMADASEVLSKLDDQGYYLQLPPQKNGYMAELRGKNEKLL